MIKRKHDFYKKTFKKYSDLTLAKTKEVGDIIGIDWSIIDLGEFRQGIKEEMEHGSEYGAASKVHDDDYVVSGRIALAHIIEVADYYQRLEDLETDAEALWGEGDEATKKRKAWIVNNYQEEKEALEAEGITNLL
jgi:hypothetical protein